MDLTLLSVMVNEARRGSRVDDSRTTQGYSNFAIKLHDAGLPTITNNHVKNRQESLRIGGRRSTIYFLILVVLHGIEQ